MTGGTVADRTSVINDLISDAPALVELSATDRILDAALECFGRWGITKSTAEDISREAEMSRASLYRAFPGGKAAILQAVGMREILRLHAGCIAVIDSTDTLEDALVDGIAEACRQLRSHRALNYLIVHEPEAVLPLVAFDRAGPALALACSTCAPSLRRFVSEDVAEELVEWAARMTLSIVFAPGFVDPTDASALRSVVSGLLLVGFESPMSQNNSSDQWPSPANPTKEEDS